MKCPKCHKEVEKGSLYCPYCLAEIPWVREFSTVETLMKKEQQNRPSEKKQKTKIIIFQASKKKKAEIQQKTASMSASVCGDTAGVLLLSAVKYFFCLIFQGKKTICAAKL